MCRFEGERAEYKGQGLDGLLMVIDKIHKRLEHALVILSVLDPLDPKVRECPPGYTFAQVRLTTGFNFCLVASLLHVHDNVIQAAGQSAVLCGERRTFLSNMLGSS